MNREFLEGLGLEKEAIDKVMAEHGKTVNATKQALEDAEGERDSLKDQLEARDTQLTELKKDVKDSEELTNRITELETENQQAKEQYESELKDVRLNSAIKTALVGQVHDEDLVAGLFDKEKLVIGDDGKVVGLDDQLKSLQEEKSFLFKSDEPEGTPEDKPGFKVGGDGQSNATPPTEAQQWIDAFK